MLKFLVVVVNVALIRAALLGGWGDGDLNDPQVKEVVNFAQTEINSRSNSMCLQKAGNIVSVKQQVVAGMNYKITWVSGGSGLSKQSNSQADFCKFSNNQLCDAVVYGQLDGTKSLARFNCQPTDFMVSKRAGGIKEEKNLDQFKDIALRAVSMSNARLQTENIRVIKASTQVVAGMKYYLTITDSKTQCEVEVWSRPWVIGDEGFKVQKFECGGKDKRALGRMGGIKEEKNLDQFTNIALKAVSMSNANLQTENIRVIKASTQVVAGMKYYLTITDSKTQCEVEVWSRPWVIGDEGFKVNKFDCSSQDKRALLGGNKAGGVSEEKTNLEAYKDILTRAVSMSNSNLENVQLLSVRTQTVAGKNYFMKFSALENGIQKTCDVIVWSRPWLSGDEGFKVTKFGC